MKGPRRFEWPTWLNWVGPLIGLVAVYILFSVLVTRHLGENRFLTGFNLGIIATQTVIVGTAALGMTLVIISGGIDLSVGSMVALTSVIAAALLKFWGWPPALAALGGVVAGVACGLMNGTLITMLRVVPFIVTLGMLLVLRGAALGVADNKTINPSPSWLDSLLAPSAGGGMLVSPGVWILAALALGVASALRFTRFGRHVFAIGSNEQAARLCGVSVTRVKIIVYATAGLFAGLAGVMQYSRLSQGDPTSAPALELAVIAAVVIGGGSLSGGEGSVLGSLIGALLMTSIANGCSLLDLDNWVQNIVTGAIIVVALALDRLRHWLAT